MQGDPKPGRHPNRGHSLIQNRLQKPTRQLDGRDTIACTFGASLNGACVGAVSLKRMNGQPRNDRPFTTRTRHNAGRLRCRCCSVRRSSTDPGLRCLFIPPRMAINKVRSTKCVLTSTVDASPRPPFHGRVTRTHGVHDDCTEGCLTDLRDGRSTPDAQETCLCS